VEKEKEEKKKKKRERKKRKKKKNELRMSRGTSKGFIQRLRER
jgi:hypothetical protein